MCNLYQNIYHQANCLDPDEHFIHISLQGGLTGRCKAGPHERYVPIPGQCKECHRRDDEQKPHSSSTTEPELAPWVEYSAEYDDEDICEFAVAWDLPLAIAGEPDVETFLLEAVTLTRTECTVKAMSCEQYIREEYGALGLVLLENIFSALYSPGGCYVVLTSPVEDSTVKIYVCPSMIDVSLFGEMYYLRDLVLWLCLSFVTPQIGDLDIDFKLLVLLSDVKWSVVHDGGFLLRGPFTALTPIEQLGDEYVVWHFEEHEHVEQFDSAELEAVQIPWLKTLSMRRLRSKKALQFRGAVGSPASFSMLCDLGHTHFLPSHTDHKDGQWGLEQWAKMTHLVYRKECHVDHLHQCYTRLNHNLVIM
ncbi:hypothetical protein P170DRAFT_423176 [Aspergillus steynii IBT 23096]|uniref:Uncharacterized protein n=1 Tax=Aspergillus steynii IBT 23096 TaxID=1392250 RepID=A0A2I2GHD8_9EURO|nr:uncharacterized protein P170DRAFT_423176 [Aspergillus steynii IBT 23096]PLB52290.1 hypothetical protein P170DRAFT_423176 [Aspergillus steynii IBT 23096]